ESVGPGNAGSADDRLRHQAAHSDARHAQDRSESHRDIRNRFGDSADLSGVRYPMSRQQRTTIMTPTLRITTALAAWLALTTPAAAQTPGPASSPDGNGTADKASAE